MARQCQIDPAGGSVVVQISVDNALISGGKLIVYDFNTGTVYETSPPLQTGTTGTTGYQINLNPADLVGQVLSWEFRTCSPTNTDNGRLSLKIFQNGNLCPTQPLASYNLTNVPNCALSLAIPAKGGLHFIN